MKTLNILIVEDDMSLAETHAEFIKRNSVINQIWLAGDLLQARIMVERLKPDLILLDNYLPDGKGIELLQELSQKKYPGGIIFLTAANDITTVSVVVRYGVFDYLIKPISYERLEQSIQRYSRFRQIITENNKVTQRQVDDLFNTFARGERKETLPIGIDELTLDKVQKLFIDLEQSYTAERVAQDMGLSRTTARRYLEFCTVEGLFVAEIVYGKVGRPQRIYKRKQ